MAECATEKVKPANAVGCECNTISGKFLFNRHPTTFLIDKEGIIRKIFPGYPISSVEGYAFNGNTLPIGSGNKAFLEELKSEIDKLLAE